jgi:hypothetical protein
MRSLLSHSATSYRALGSDNTIAMSEINIHSAIYKLNRVLKVFESIREGADATDLIRKFLQILFSKLIQYFVKLFKIILNRFRIFPDGQKKISE